jgi:hypothetical protein
MDVQGNSFFSLVLKFEKCTIEISYQSLEFYFRKELWVNVQGAMLVSTVD